MIIITPEICRKGLKLSEDQFNQKMGKKLLGRYDTEWQQIWAYAKERHESRIGSIRDQFDDTTGNNKQEIKRKIFKALHGSPLEKIEFNSQSQERRSRGSQRQNQRLSPEQQEINDLKAQIDQLNERLSNFRVLDDLFKERNRRGNRFEYCDLLQAVSVELLCESISSSDLVKIYNIFGDFLNLIDAPDKHVPKRDYFVKLRSKIEESLRKQSKEFIEQAEYVMCATDATSHWESGVFAFGLFNQDMEWNCLELLQSEGKSGEAIANDMLNVMSKYNVPVAKLICLVTDRSRAQERANRIFCEIVNSRKPEGSPLIYYVCCLMHTVSNADTKPQKWLLQDSQKTLSYLKQFFGNRVSSGFSRKSLRKELESLLGRSSPFQTDIGSRYAISFNNARYLIIYESDVYRALQSNSARHEKHHELKTMMANQEKWGCTRLEIMVPFLVWEGLLSPFHQTISKNVTYGTVKHAFNELRSKITNVKGAEVNRELERGQYERILTLADNDDISEDSKKAIEQIYLFWMADETKEEWKQHLDEFLYDYMAEIEEKINSDAEIIFNLPIHDNETRIPWTNRRMVSFLKFDFNILIYFQESTFAYLKAIAHRYSMMLKENVAMLAKAKQNHTADWIKAHEYSSVSGGSVKAAYYALREDRRLEIERRDNELHDEYNIEDEED